MTHKTEELYWHAFSQLVVIPEYFDRQWIPILGSWNIRDDEGKYKELMNRTNNNLKIRNKRFNGLFEKNPSLLEFCEVVEAESRYQAQFLEDTRMGRMD